MYIYSYIFLCYIYYHFPELIFWLLYVMSDQFAYTEYPSYPTLCCMAIYFEQHTHIYMYIYIIYIYMYIIKCMLIYIHLYVIHILYIIYIYIINGCQAGPTSSQRWTGTQHNFGTQPWPLSNALQNLTNVTKFLNKLFLLLNVFSLASEGICIRIYESFSLEYKC